MTWLQAKIEDLKKLVKAEKELPGRYINQIESIINELDGRV